VQLAFAQFSTVLPSIIAGQLRLIAVAGETRCPLYPDVPALTELLPGFYSANSSGLVDEDAQAADLLQEYEAKIAALERMVGRQALEIEFLKGALKNAPRPRSVNTSVITGPAASPSQKDAG
jgi:transposase